MPPQAGLEGGGPRAGGGGEAPSRPQPRNGTGPHCHAPCAGARSPSREGGEPALGASCSARLPQPRHAITGLERQASSPRGRKPAFAASESRLVWPPALETPSQRGERAPRDFGCRPASPVGPPCAERDSPRSPRCTEPVRRRGRRPGSVMCVACRCG